MEKPLSGHTMDEKKYLIDNEPASARDIIELAKEYNEDFRDSFIKQTSIAAEILRDAGHKIGKRGE